MPELRPASLLRRPGRYAEDYDCGDPGRPSFVHPDVPYNAELVKYVEFNTIPLDHPGPNPSRQRYLEAQERVAQGLPVDNLMPAAQHYGSSQNSEMSTETTSQAAKVVSLSRPAPPDSVLAGDEFDEENLPSVEFDKDKNDQSLEGALLQWWDLANPGEPPKRVSLKNKYPTWADLTEGTKLAIMSDLTNVPGVDFTIAARVQLALTQAERIELLDLWFREVRKHQAYEDAFKAYLHRRQEALLQGVRLDEYPAPADFVTDSMTGKELRQGRLFLISCGLERQAAGLGHWQGQGAGLVKIDLGTLYPFPGHHGQGAERASANSQDLTAPLASQPGEAPQAPVALPSPAALPSTAAVPSTSASPSTTVERFAAVSLSAEGPPPVVPAKRPRGRPRKVQPQANKPGFAAEKLSQDLTMPPVLHETTDISADTRENSGAIQQTVTTSAISDAEPVAAQIATPQQQLPSTMPAPAQEPTVIVIDSDSDEDEEHDRDIEMPDDPAPPQPLPAAPQRVGMTPELMFGSLLPPAPMANYIPTAPEPQLTEAREPSPVYVEQDNSEDEDWKPARQRKRPRRAAPQPRAPPAPRPPRKSRAVPGARRGRPRKNPLLDPNVIQQSDGQQPQIQPPQVQQSDAAQPQTQHSRADGTGIQQTGIQQTGIQQTEIQQPQIQQPQIQQPQIQQPQIQQPELSKLQKLELELSEVKTSRARASDNYIKSLEIEIIRERERLNNKMRHKNPQPENQKAGGDSLTAFRSEWLGEIDGVQKKAAERSDGQPK